MDLSFNQKQEDYRQHVREWPVNPFFHFEGVVISLIAMCWSSSGIGNEKM